MNFPLRSMTSVYFTWQDQILLLYRIGSRVVTIPAFCGVGGHFEPEDRNEPLACAQREVYEEIGLTPQAYAPLALCYVTLRLKNGELRQNYYFFAELNRPLDPLPACTEGTLVWSSFDALCEKPMPFTAKAVLAHWLKNDRRTDTLFTGAAQPDGVVFTPMREF